MSRRLSKDVRSHLSKATESALLAVELYNKPLVVFRTGGYVALMCIAYTSLLLAVFLRDGKKPYYRRTDRPDRYIYEDGEKKAWDLSRCVSEYFGSRSCPVRSNIEFFIGLRNQIEHRSMPQIDASVSGECQALLFNFEDLLVREFGNRYALCESLVLALQFSRTHSDEQRVALRSLHSTSATTNSVHSYIDRFRSSLSSDIYSSLQFSFKVFLLPRINNHHSKDAIAIHWIDPNLLSADEMASIESIAALIKTRTKQISNQRKYRPKAVCEEVTRRLASDGIEIRMNASYHHAKAVRYFGVKPRGANQNPTATKWEYCQYNESHGDYVYTEDWISLLCKSFRDPKVRQEILNSRSS